MTRIWILLIALLIPSLAFGAILVTDGTLADVQAKVNAAADGDTVIIPDGTHTWDDPLIISGKGIHLMGETYGAVTIMGNLTDDGSNIGVIDIAKDASHSVEVSQLVMDSTATSADQFETSMIKVGGSWNDEPVIVHHCDLHTVGGFNRRAGQLRANGALFYQCNFYTDVPNFNGLRIRISDDTEGWQAVSTMGDADSTGKKNVYIEDCYFEQGSTAVIDADDNARVVFRNNTVNTGSFSAHGADTSDYGVRHFEIYDNAFQYDVALDPSAGMNYWLFLRGGTGAIHGNDYEDIPFKSNEVKLVIQNLSRSAGPNGCWSADDAGVVEYPVPRQIGLGYIDGTGLDGQGRNVDTITFVGDSEPLYIWSNTGDGAVDLTPVVVGYSPSECTNPDAASGYIQEDRDYFYSLDATDAKPAYTPFTYPHPLRGVPSYPSAPQGLSVRPAGGSAGGGLGL